MALVNHYLKLTEKYKEEYGEKTVLLMQVGAFYEMYGLREPNSDKIVGSSILEFSKLCDLAISDKKACVGKRNVMMAGFRDYNLDKYINKIQKNNYTTVVYSQDEKAAGTTRSLTGIYSPGTYFSNNTEKLNNNIVCIWIKRFHRNVIVGLSNIDIYTGKSHIYEYMTPYSNSPQPYDELERFISIFNPSEIIIIANVDEIDLIVNYAGIKTECIHKINIEKDKTTMSTRAVNCEKQTYQKEIIKSFFEESIFDHGDFLENNIATQSFCFLLDFIYQHNPNLIRKINIPLFENCSDRLILANHSLKQLNMISCDDNHSKLSSVSKFLNNCITCMGQRRFNIQLMNPVKNVDFLNQEYSITKHILENQPIDEVRNKLNLMRDIEKLNRKLILKKITPYDFYHFSQNLQEIEDLFIKLTEDQQIATYLKNYIKYPVNEFCRKLIGDIKHIFILNKINEINTLDFEDNFIKKNYNKEHDKCVEEWMDSYDKLEGIRQFLDDKISSYESNKKKSQLIKIYQTEKMGYSLIATKRRTTLLENELKKSHTNECEIIYYSKFKKKDCKFVLKTDDLMIKQTTGSNYSIDSLEISKLCSNIISSKTTMVKSLNALYMKFIDHITEHSELIDEVVLFVSIIDVVFSKAYTAKRYDHRCPEIDATREESFIELEGLRHPLIEQLLQNEIYVKNDVAFNDETLGILLYGTNAVGKSSFIKAIGISLIMAQAGMFVPCTKFRFKPYSYLFTRILGNDNLFKGLSTFEVEMLELKTILTLADKESLILGDELCSGTETDSAISIFIAGINKLYDVRSNFIFATHFHEIVNYDEITQKTYLALKHMTVVYDKQKDTLIYDRHIRNGPGESMYGLEVCKSLHLPSEFLMEAHALRSKYNPIKKSILDMKTSHYNQKKLKSFCEMCKKKMASEVHHLQHQKDADENGYIDGFHKNHLGNLYAVCEDCHDKLHENMNGHIKVTTSEGTILKNVC